MRPFRKKKKQPNNRPEKHGPASGDHLQAVQQQGPALDEYLQVWKKYCQEHENHPACQAGTCVNVHPSYVLRWIKEVEQMTYISLAYGREVVQLREENEKLRKELESARAGR